MDVQSATPCWHVALTAELRDADARPLQRERPTGFDRAIREAEANLGEGILAAPVQIERGAAVQALFRRAAGVAGFVAHLSDAMHPLRWVAGLGFGLVDARTRGESIVLDGPALDRARAALWTARRDRRSAVAVGFGSPEDEVLASLFELCEQIRGGWTERQAETVRAARALKGKEVAERFGVSPSVVSESLKAASFRPLVRAEAAMAELLDRFGNEGIWRGPNVVFPDILSPLSRESRQLVSRR